MLFERLSVEGLLLLKPDKHGDHRGFFSETYRADSLFSQGVTAPFVQDNHVLSTGKGVLRGLHFQISPHAQGKLVRCTRGSILDVGVDIRTGSPTYGAHVAVELSAANWHQLWIPPGFAHGYVTLEENCEVLYKATEYYAPASDRGISWDDPALGIDWRFSAGEITLSAKDKSQPRLADVGSPFRFGS